MSQKGKINVQTENIFPIIKKFLYSDTEIFLRELVSNAVDASQKLKTLSSIGEFKGEATGLRVDVSVDKDKKQIIIKDKGVGMTAEEIDKYINQVAFSGAEEFVQKYKDQNKEAIIGHFGLGFYSAFMVAERVEIQTLSFREDAKAVRWECDGSPEFSIEDFDKKERGTEIILHVSEEGEEFLEEERLKTILNKYCKFLPVEIYFKDELINNPNPTWTKKPADLKDEDYSNFYKELYPFSEDPLFHIHLNVDYPFNLTGILYFPKIQNKFEVQKDKIQLYSNQVFVTDAVEGIVPEFLTLLHGVIDSPDIPLNVSRSYLQSDANVKKISSHITKKVADKLEELYKNNREDFEKKWDDIKLFIEFGMLSDEKFFDRAKKFALLKNIEGKHFSFEEYQEKIKENQTDKDNKQVFLYTTDQDAQYSYIAAAKDKGYDALELDGPLVGHIVNKFEQHFENSTFARVDADVIEKLIKKEDVAEVALTDDEKKQVEELINKNLEKEKFMVSFENLGETGQPIIITRPEFMRRMADMQKTGGGGMFMGNMPETFNLIVNGNHPLVSKVLKEVDDNKKQQLTKQMTDLALLSQNMLKGQALADFVKRSVELI